MARKLINVSLALIALICLTIVVGLFALPKLEARARQRIVDQLSQTLQAKVDLQQVKLASLWPLGLRLDHLDIVPKSGQWRATADESLVRFKYLGRWRLEVRMSHPVFQFRQSTTASAAPSETSSSSLPGFRPPAISSPLSRPLDVILQLDQARLTILTKDSTTTFNNFTLHLEKEDLFNFSLPFKLDFKTPLELKNAWMNSTLQVQVTTSDLVFNPKTGVSTQNSHIRIGGVDLRLHGYTHWGTPLVHDWTAQVKVPDLKKLPAPPSFLPAKDWAGTLSALVHIKGSKDLKADGNLDLNQVRCVLDYKSTKVSIQGPAQIDLRGKFAWAPGNWSMKDMKWNLKLTEANVAIPQYFDKPAGVELSSTGQGQVTPHVLELKRALLNLNNMNASLDGNASYDQASDLKWDIKVPSLAGWEKYIRPLSGSPLHGDVSGKGEIKGALNDLKTLKVSVSDLHLDQVAGAVEFQSSDMSVSGPFSANVKLNGTVQGADVTKGNVSGQFDASGLKIKYGSLFHKDASETLKLSVGARKSGRSLHLTRLDIVSPFGQLLAQGDIQNPLDPTVTLKAQMTISDLKRAQEWSGILGDRLSMVGTATANLDISGHRDAKNPWYDWPLNVHGQVALKVLHAEYADEAKSTSTSPSAASSVKVAGPDSKKATGFLPKGAMTRNLNLRVLANIGLFQGMGLSVGPIKIQGVVADGKFQGVTEIDKLFNGQVNFRNMTLPLLAPHPVVTSKVELRAVELKSALAFVMPQWKDLASGPIWGDIQMHARLPSDPLFYDGLRSQGHIQIQPIHLSMRPLSEMINDKITKIPKLSPIRLDDMNGTLNSDFTMSGRDLHIKKMQAVDVKGSELDVTGHLQVGQSMDLKADLFLSDVPFKGCIKEANQDSRGRFHVPLVLKGAIQAPSWDVAGDLLRTLGEKALKCEARKFIDKQRDNLQNNIKDGLKKGLKNLLGH